MPYHGMSEDYAADLEAKATLISWLFIIEMSLKLLVLGCVGYWADGWNQLDGTIVIISIVEMLLTWLLAGSGFNVTFLRILRMLRVARLLRLMKSWRYLEAAFPSDPAPLFWPRTSHILASPFLRSHIPASPPLASLCRPSRSRSDRSRRPSRPCAVRYLYKIVVTVMKAMPQMSNVLILLFLVTMM